MEVIICSTCEALRKELIKKEEYINDLISCLKGLSHHLANFSNGARQKIVDETGFDAISLETSSNEITLCSTSSNINFYILNTVNNTIVKSCSVDTQTSDDLTTETTKECLKNSSNLKDNPDYIFDENYQMYYNVSTGYYYDEKRGLMYEPQSCIYYKYNYDKQEYEVVPSNETAVNTSNDFVSESVVDQVNNLNLNDDNSTNPQIPICENMDYTKTDKSSETLNLNVFEPSPENNGSLPSRDWQIAEGSDMTITDMVKEVVNEYLSDYVYDETSKTYYSPSTGHIYNAETKLLYDPSSGAYYLYDEENQIYQYYCQAVSSASTTQESVEAEWKRGERLKTRKQFWRKKMNKAKEITVPEIFMQADKDSCEEFSSPEEGELFSSDEEDNESNQPVSIVRSPIKGVTKQNDEMPSSIRAIVEHAERLKIGSLILITCSGGIIGRERSHPICVPEVCVSKVHAEIKYNTESQEYTIEDLGSQNGTFVNEIRLSEPKEKSLPRVLQHGDKLSLGSCKLLLHMHINHETCDECEPGQVLAGHNTTTQKDENIAVTKEEKEKLRRETNRKLKMKYGLIGQSFQEKSKSAPGYEDKAEMRRKAVGSDNPHEKTEQASVYSHMPKSNKGYMMLEKMGWKEGDSLGNKSGGGIPEPISITPWIKKSGLGSTNSACSMVDISAGETKKVKRWVKAQERYYSDALPSVPPCNAKLDDNINDYS